MSYQNLFVFLGFIKLTGQGCKIFCNILSKCIDTVSISNSRLDDFVVSCQTINSSNNNDQITISANMNLTGFQLSTYLFL